MPDFKWILKESKLPWLKLDLEFPYQAMYEEAKSLIWRNNQDKGQGNILV